MEKKCWFYKKGEEKIGPLSQYELRELLVEEEINEKTPICLDSDPVWQPLSEVAGFAVGGIDEPAVVDDTREDTQTIRKTRPWVRYWARILDYTLFSFIIGFILGFSQSTLLERRPLFVGMFIIFLWVFVEAFLLATWGTTPGKWLFRISVRSVDGKKPIYLASLYRSLSVWFFGVGLGLPIISIITMIVSYVKLSKKKITSWDRSNHLHVEHHKIGFLRIFVAILFFAIMIYLSLPENIQMHQMQREYF
ncbi:MAG: RDD family protein [Simkaniaceae bacterium]|nr:RDD family protein [Simkaniaceae bacterium]